MKIIVCFVCLFLFGCDDEFIGDDSAKEFGRQAKQYCSSEGSELQHVSWTRSYSGISESWRYVAVIKCFGSLENIEVFFVADKPLNNQEKQDVYNIN